jgi:Thiamine-binding protein
MLIAFSITPAGAGEAVGEIVAEAVRVVRASGLPNQTDSMFTTIEAWATVSLTDHWRCDGTKTKARVVRELADAQPPDRPKSNCFQQKATFLPLERFYIS